MEAVSRSTPLFYLHHGSPSTVPYRYDKMSSLRLRLLPTAILLLLSAATTTTAQSFPYKLPKEDMLEYNNVRGFPIDYRATQYEPICGNLGWRDTRYLSRIDEGTNCSKALDAFLTSPDPAAVHLLDGTKKIGGRMGAGYEACLCFAVPNNQLEVGTTDKIKGALCIWANGDAVAEYHVVKDERRSSLTASYAPYKGNALTNCKFDEIVGPMIERMKASWTATQGLAAPTGMCTPLRLPGSRVAGGSHY
jgi:hypothetical protein